MQRSAMMLLGLCGSLVVSVCTVAGEPAQEGGIEPAIDQAASIQNFRIQHSGIGFTYLGDRIERVHGPAFGQGDSPEATAEQFRLNHAGMWGIAAADLAPVGPFEDGRHTTPIMYEPQTQTYKFTGVYYSQVRDGVPVFRSRLTLLVRNKEDFPLVLASADLRDIGDFRVAPGAGAVVNSKAGLDAVKQVVGAEAQIVAGAMVIWAGVDKMVVPPVLAIQFMSEGGDPGLGNYQKTLFLTDAQTGAILYQESQVHEVDIAGTVKGMATQGYGADLCDVEAIEAMPYAAITNGATIVFADVNGNFVFPNAGTGPVTLSSLVAGQYFDLDSGPDTPLAPPPPLMLTGPPPGPMNFVHNAANADEFTRAEVNAYIHANIVRDYVLFYNRQYPVIAGQTGFDINVNINLNCNAFYNGSSINFYVSNASCSNTANSTVVYHEYGHHVVQSGGSGQGPYGEGMADCVAVLVTDDPCLGRGFHNNCNACLRNADNPCQYDEANCSSCGSANHSCGRLLSGCVWSTRNELLSSHPLTYRQILSVLTINSVMLHSGNTITPSITVDFLTLDDDNEDITDGTPHYAEINAGFSAHNMPAPPLGQLGFNFPNGKPEYVHPDGGTVMRVEVFGVLGTPQPGAVNFIVSTGGGGFAVAPINQVSPNVYDAIFPGSTCGTIVKYFLSAQTDEGQVVLTPPGAPGSVFTAWSAASEGKAPLDDNFETDQGWTVTNSGLTNGAWERATPTILCNRGNPLIDADESGMCYVTDNAGGGDPGSDEFCDTDVDGGTTMLISPIIDASSLGLLSYWRWYDNIHPNNPTQDDPMVVEFSLNGGSTWLNLETIGPTGDETNGGWVFVERSLTLIPGFVPTSQFRLRFIVQDLGGESVVEAGVDGVKVQLLECADGCPADVDSDGTVNVSDLLALIGAWGQCQGPCLPSCVTDLDGDCVVNVSDMLALIGAWGVCP